jgi:hypothetical protein
MRSASERVRLAAFVAAALVARSASAGGEVVDASYGRIAGDVGLVAGVGAVVAEHGPRGRVELRLRYLDTVGLFGSYEDAGIFGGTVGPERVLAGGVELRPLFLYRWLQGHETGRPRLDLMLDSIGIDLAAIAGQPQGAGFASRAGVELGLGVELPVFASASGPWVGLYGALRWSEGAMGAGVLDGSNDREGILAVTIAWHQVITAHVVDIGDRAPR